MKKLPFLLFHLLLSIILIHSCSGDPDSPSITIENKVLHELKPELFGQFMEKCSWDHEVGGDLVINPVTGDFDPLVLEQLKAMNIPVMRYPGGSDVDYYNWTDLIDHAPGQTERKPYQAYRKGDGDSIVSDNRLGLNEFLELCEMLNSEAIIVLNIGDAFYKKISLQQAKENAAAVFAYCNMTEVPGGSDWPKYRKLNGREEPFNVKYFQIGNESWGFKGFDWRADNPDPEKIQHLFNCIIAVADTLKALDPDINIIADGPFLSLNKLYEEQAKEKIDYIVFHPYMPWSIDSVFNAQGEYIAPHQLNNEDTWKAWVSTPAIDTGTGVAILPDYYAFNNALNSSFNIAVTEWNWNGWYGGEYVKQNIPQPDLAKGIGAAGFLHSYMRRGDRIKMACQSMLAGKAWGITGIRIDPEYKQASVTLPTAMVTGLYSNYHGDRLLKTSVNNIPIYEQAYKMNSIAIHPQVACLDILSSRSDKQLFIHVINRSYNRQYAVEVNLAGISPKQEYKRYAMLGDKTAGVKNKKLEQKAYIVESDFNNAANQFKIDVPAASVSTYVFELN